MLLSVAPHPTRFFDRLSEESESESVPIKESDRMTVGFPVNVFGLTPSVSGPGLAAQLTDALAERRDELLADGLDVPRPVLQRTGDGEDELADPGVVILHREGETVLALVGAACA